MSVGMSIMVCGNYNIEQGDDMDIIYESVPEEVCGMLTLKDDQNQLKRYVRRIRNKRNVQPSVIPDLLQTDDRRVEFAEVNTLKGKNLRDEVVLMCQGSPEVIGPPSNGPVQQTAVVVDVYHADERAYWIWEKFREKTMQNNTLDAREIKRLLDNTKPQLRPWLVQEVKVEKEKWDQDKGTGKIGDGKDR